jgi:uridylate kinase
MRRSPRRILLKLSGEAIKGPDGALSSDALDRIIREITSLERTELAVVVGGGNILRGARTSTFERIEADTLGMLATVVNALALHALLKKAGREACVQSAIHTELTDPISVAKARDLLASGGIVLFAGGTGSPLVSTDTAAAIRAVSIGADLLAKGSNVRGVYDGDPAADPAAALLPKISYADFLDRRYGVMDQIAVEICREHEVPIEVFDFAERGALAKLASGGRIGTRIE